MFWTDLVVTNLVWQCMFIIWSILWKGYFAVFKVKVTVKVRNFSECLSGQYLWSIKVSMVMHHHEPEYDTEIYLAIFKVKATIVSTRSSAILKLFQSKWVFWYTVTRRGKTLWTDFIALLRAWDRIWLGWLRIRLLLLLAILRYVKQGSVPVPIKKNVERTLPL